MNNKICTHCNQQVDGSAKFCPNCGSTEFREIVNDGTNYYNAQNNQQYNPYGQAPGAQQQYSQPGYTQPPYGYQMPGQNPYSSPQFPMKWYKFLINFALIFGAVINLATGILYLTGEIYALQSTTSGIIVTSDLVYAVFDGVQTLDIIMGVVMIALAIFAIYTRMCLAKFKSNGPMCLYILYGVGAAGSLLYNVAVMAVTDLDVFDAASITSIAMSAVMIALNCAYFNKRKSLFVN